MKKFRSLIIILFVWITPSQILLAQSNSYNGISLHSSSGIRNSFIQGEPVSFLFILKNNTEHEINYCKKLTGVNIYYTLFDSKEQIVGSSENEWKSFANIRSNAKSKTPNKGFSFAPWEQFLIELKLGSIVSGYLPEDVEANVPFVHGGEDLQVLPEGNYRLKVEYFLYPSNEKIEVLHPFKVMALPNDETEAYQAFKEATVYTAKNYFKFENNYDPNNPGSYENFIKNYPSSIFVQYAYTNLVKEIYNYPNNIPSSIKGPIFYDYFLTDKVNLSNLKLSKARAALKSLNAKDVKNPGQVIDRQLRGLQNEDPAISDNLIEAAKERLKLKDLKNYACEKN